MFWLGRSKSGFDLAGFREGVRRGLDLRRFLESESCLRFRSVFLGQGACFGFICKGGIMPRRAKRGWGFHT